MNENKPETSGSQKAAAHPHGPVTLGSFGKHPAWNDFMDHVGGETPFMARAKKEFFFGTIRTLIEARRWQAAPDDASTPPRPWYWLWQERNEFLIGLLWPSRDGTSAERKFPMSLCAHGKDLDVFWALDHLLPVLADAADHLKKLATQEEVLQCVDKARLRCQELLDGAPAPASPYLARAEQLAAEKWLRDAPDALPRVFYFIHTRLEALAISARDVARKKTEEHEAMRLPCPDHEFAGHICGWLAFLRTQIDNEAPILLVHPAGTGWCDAIFGAILPEADLSMRNTLRLGQGLAEIPLTTETRYPLEPDFLLRVGQTLDAVRLDWGNAAKRTIFGPVPPKYRPNLPGEKTAGGLFHFGASPWAGLITSVKQRLKQGRPKSTVKSKFSFRWAGLAAAILAIGLLMVLAVALFPSFSGSRPKSANPPPAQDQQQLMRDWRDYVRDYEQWLKNMLDSSNSLRTQSPFFNAHLQRIIAGANLPSLEPLTIYGSRARLNLTEPDLKELASRQQELKRAYAARDQIKSLIQTEFPAKVAEDIQHFAGTPLEAAAHSLLPEKGTNLSLEDVSAQASRLVSCEQSVAQLTTNWDQWQKARNELAQYDTNQLARLTRAQERPLAAVSKPAEADSRLRTLLTEEGETLDWVKAAWGGIDHPGLLAALSQTNVVTISGWTNLAAGYRKIFVDSDPRAALGGRLEQIETNQMQDIRVLAEASNQLAVSAVADLSPRCQQLHSEIAILTNRAAIQKNEASLNQQIEQTGAEIDSLAAQTKKVWDKICDFNGLVKQEQGLDFKSPLVNGLWSGYIARAREMVPASARLKRDDLMRWRSKFDLAGKFFRQLADLRAGAVVSPLLQRPETAELANQVFATYCSRLVETNMDSGLGMRQTFDQFCAGPQKAGLDEAVATFSEKMVQLLDDLSAAARGNIPANLNASRDRYRLLVESGMFPTNDSPQLRLLRELNQNIWSSTADAGKTADDFRRNPPPDFLRAALWLARFNEFPDWPGSVTDWKAVVDIFDAARQQIAIGPPPLDKEAASRSLQAWLETEWGKTGSRVQKFEDIQQCASAVTNPSDVPPNLAYNDRLAALALSFDGNVPAFQKKTASFLSSQVADAHRQILASICNLPPDGTGWGNLAPARLNIQISHGLDGKVWLVQQGLSNEFKLKDRVFVSVSEFSCDEFGQFANPDSTVLLKWFTDLQQAYADSAEQSFYEDAASYLNNLSPDIDTSGAVTHLKNVVVRRSRTSGPGSKLAQAPILQNFSVVTGSQAVNFVSPELAVKAAAAWGCRLLTPQEWINNFDSPATAAQANLENTRIYEACQELKQRLEKPKILESLFFVKPSRPASPAADAGTELLSDLAEFLRDGSQYYVASGTLAPRAMSRTEAARGFADVGFRLAFDWAGVDSKTQVREILATLHPLPAAMKP